MVKNNANRRICDKVGEARRGLELILSPLECDVVEVLWDAPQKQMKVREIHARLGAEKKKFAVTSVAVILDRLHERGLVARRAETGRGGVHYLYSAKTSKRDFQKTVVADAVENLIKSFGGVAVSYFNERFSKKK